MPYQHILVDEPSRGSDASPSTGRLQRIEHLGPQPIVQRDTTFGDYRTRKP
jgi:hypothetical protein